MRTTHQIRVDQFMRLAGQEVPTEVLYTPSKELRILRAKLIFEECLETISKGLGVDISSPQTVITSPQCHFKFTIGEYRNGEFDLEETLDGCADIAVVTTGTLSAFGVDDVPLQEEVDKNNLAKFGPGGYRAEGEDSKDKPGPKGKWIKPPGHKPPNIFAVIDAVRREQEGFPSKKECLEIAEKEKEIPLDGENGLGFVEDEPKKEGPKKMGGPEHSFQEQIDQYEKSKPKSASQNLNLKWGVIHDYQHPDQLKLEMNFDLDNGQEYLILRDIKKILFHQKESFKGLYDAIEQRMITFNESQPPLKSKKDYYPDVQNTAPGVGHST